ncbi:MAG: M23 family metallopeptidase [Tannerella sp.]|jgi:hypothetical protein|nr:M23 family metallopeptidase [Tannerella sp.]
MYRITICLTLLWGLIHCPADAQTLRNPLDIQPLLSGNFGELRANHFHSGIDFKTQGVEGKNVYSVRDGYICRLVVSPWGYGNVVYVAHPADSLMTVYAHLQRFTEDVAAYVTEKQYELERFSVDLTCTPDQFPLNLGEIVGYSGNSGGSGGPHLHFEVRDWRTDEPVDPLPYYAGQIKDTRSPKARAVMIYPVEGAGVVNRSAQKQKWIPAATGNAQTEAWGKIAFSINVDDYMDGLGNVYGVKEISMSVDDDEIFHSYLDRFSFDETRYLNAWVDYEIWREQRSFYTKTFVEPGNRLRFITSKNRGILTIDEPRIYHVVFQLTDAFGNTEQIALDVTGEEQPISAPDTDDATLFYWRADNRFGASGIRLLIPGGSLYHPLYFRYAATRDTTGLSDIHTLHDRPVPLHRPAQLSLRLHQDTLEEKRHYGIVSLWDKKRSWIGGTYRDGWIDADIRELGTYLIASDTVAPRITPVEPAQWMHKEAISFRLTDNLSGVETYRGTIDGQYVLFEMDGKKSLIYYTFDRSRLSRGEHALSLTVADRCGNTSVYETSFIW